MMLYCCNVVFVLCSAPLDHPYGYEPSDFDASGQAHDASAKEHHTTSSDHGTQAAATVWRDRMHGLHHPPPQCLGKCFAGKCVLDKSRSGCCTLAITRPKDRYAEAASKAVDGDKDVSAAEQAGLTTMTGNGVYCWEGRGSRY